MDEEFIKQVFAELIDANEQAIAILASATGDVIGRPELARALQQRLSTAQVAQPHPTRDKFLATALQSLQSGK